MYFPRSIETDDDVSDCATDGLGADNDAVAPCLSFQEAQHFYEDADGDVAQAGTWELPDAETSALPEMDDDGDDDDTAIAVAIDQDEESVGQHPQQQPQQTIIDTDAAELAQPPPAIPSAPPPLQSLMDTSCIPIIEATLIVDERSSGSGHVSRNSDRTRRTWWQRHLRTFILSFYLLIVLIVALSVAITLLVIKINYASDASSHDSATTESAAANQNGLFPTSHPTNLLYTTLDITIEPSPIASPSDMPSFPSISPTIDISSTLSLSTASTTNPSTSPITMEDVAPKCLSSLFQKKLLSIDCFWCYPRAAISNNIAVVTDSYYVYFYSISNTENSSNGNTEPWSLIASDYVGTSSEMPVAISSNGNIVAVGAFQESDSVGAAYLYQRGMDEKGRADWNTFQRYRIVPDGESNIAWFGYSVAVDDDGDVVVIGAPNDNSSSSRNRPIGSAYVFRRRVLINSSTNLESESVVWEQDARLGLSDFEPSSNFGSMVAIHDDIILVSDPNYGFGDEGIVYLYRYDFPPLVSANPTSSTPSRFWIKMQNPLKSDDCVGQFGSSIKMLPLHSSSSSENNLFGTKKKWEIFVGCHLENESTGAIYRYDLIDDTSIFRQKITASNGKPNDNFGAWDQVAVDGNLMIVGTYKSDNEGRVHVYKRRGGSDANNSQDWIEARDKFADFLTITVPVDEVSNHFFGHYVSISGNNVLISSSNNVYAFHLDVC